MGKTNRYSLSAPSAGNMMIVYLPIEELPKCPNPECKGTRMIIEELLDEGKSF